MHKAREAKRMKLESSSNDRNDPVVGVNDDNAEIVNLDEVERDVNDLPVTGKDENDADESEIEKICDVIGDYFDGLLMTSDQLS